MHVNGEPLYVSAQREPKEPLYITILDGRVQPTLALDELSFNGGQDSWGVGNGSESAQPGNCLQRGSPASSRRSASTSTTCSGPVDEPEDHGQIGGLPSTPVRLIWCEGNPDKRKEQMQACASQLSLSPRHFGSPSSFTRWYFEQTGPGQVAKLGPVLVVGWREAKPCGAAIKAALTGNMEGLRNDCKRPQLSQQVRAVRVMIILAESSTQGRKVRDWIKSEDFLSKIMQFRVIVDVDNLGSVLREFL